MLIKTCFTLILLFTTFANAQEKFEKDIIKQTFGYSQESRAIVDLSELHQGCPERDCIPSIDNPEFVKARETEAFSEDEIVMVVDHNGVQKAYSFLIMQFHEIVNDNFNGQPVVVTYCPLCASAIAFIPKVNGKYSSFGVSGVLHNSDLVMYDRETYSLWGQITGRAIVGPRAGERLKRVYVSQHRFKKAKQLFPKLQILLPPKNIEINYQKDAYEDYHSEDTVKFPVALKDARLLNKTTVYGFEVNGFPVAIEKQYLIDNKALFEVINGKHINVSMQADGLVRVYNLTDKMEIMPTLVYWFAWFNFHPKTRLIKS